MLNLDERVGIGSQPTLAEWASRALGLPEVRVQIRLRGNNLYLLCEGDPCPDVATAVPRFARSLANHPLEALTSPGQPRIYQVFLSGREMGRNRPDWTVRLDPDKLDRYLEPSKPSGIPQPEPPSPTPWQPTFSSYKNINSSLYPTGPINGESERGIEESYSYEVFASTFLTQAAPEPIAVENLANRRQALSGDPDAIARYLGETLSNLGVGVKVRIKDLHDTSTERKSKKGVGTGKANPLEDIPITSQPNQSSSREQTSNPASKPKKRLWILCESAYSPDPSLLADPIAGRLRDLLEKRQGESLTGFRDAVIVGQVSGETKPDWMLRVDLTPPEEMLKAWACWGDVEAIALLLNRVLAESNVAVRGILEEATLHLFCSHILGASDRPPPQQNQTAPDRSRCYEAIAPVLQSLVPQGIQAATIYGLVGSKTSEELPSAVRRSPNDEETPAWIDWVTIKSPKVESALDLAKRGNVGAIAFLLDRVVNPDLTAKLSTGGIRILALRKGDLLHILSESPVSPQPSRVRSPIVKFLRQLQIPGIVGVRVYGRRSGIKHPQWGYGDELILAPLTPPQTPPDFAPSVADGGDFLPQPGELILRPEFQPSEESSGLRKLSEDFVEGVQQTLAGSQLFIPNNTVSTEPTPHGMWIALVWGTLGLLLTVQADWAIGQFLRETAKAKQPLLSDSDAEMTLDSQETRIFTGNSRNSSPTTLSVPLPQLSLPKSKTDDESVFNASGFTQQSGNQIAISGQCQTKGGEVDPDSCILEKSSYPSFNSRQLDEQLLVYQKYLAELGPPDILIVGSSRALRGLDPATLQKALKEQGYVGNKIFNFGINGATAQVVDMLVRQILKPEQLPKMIVWADGARALNGGRVDVTYNAIAASEGYKQIVSGKYPIQTPESSESTEAKQSPGTPEVAPVTFENYWASGYQEIGRRLNEKLGAISATYQERDRLKTLFQQKLAAIGQQQLVKSPTLNKSSDSESIERMAASGGIDSNGFLALMVRFNSVTYYQKHPKVPGNYDADYESFQLAGRQTVALKTLLQFTRERQIPVIFINLPLTADYLDPARAAYEEEFRQHMMPLAIEEEFIFRDLSELWPNQNEYFSDPSHLNRYGAYEVALRIANDPMIPWLVSDKAAFKSEN